MSLLPVEGLSFFLSGDFILHLTPHGPFFVPLVFKRTVTLSTKSTTPDLNSTVPLKNISSSALKLDFREQDLSQEIKDFRSGKSNFSTLYYFIKELANAAFGPFKKGYPEIETDDVCQECLMAAHKLLKRADFEVGNSIHFFYKCFQNILIDMARTASRERKVITLVSTNDLDHAETPERMGELEDKMVEIKTRFHSFFAFYTINRVFSAMIYGGIESDKKYGLINSLIMMTGKDRNTVRFMIEYAIVVIRQRFLKGLNFA